MQLALLGFPFAVREQAAGGRGFGTPQGAQIAFGQPFQLIARGNAHAGERIGPGDGALKQPERLDRHNFFKSHMANHGLFIRADGQRAHFPLIEVRPYRFFYFTAIKQIGQCSRHNCSFRFAYGS